MRKLSGNINSGAKKSKAKGFFVFFIGDEGAILSYFEKGEVLRRLFSPAADAKPTETFKELFAEYPAAPITMLVDMVEQSYVRQTLPPVTSLGVNKIIQRRLARDFAPDDLKGALSLGREKSGRKDWNVLLIALAYKDALRDWCELIYDLPNRFMGVYLSPVESEGIVRLLNAQLDFGIPDTHKRKIGLATLLPARAGNKALESIQARWDILVVHNKTGGFRQVVLKNGGLVFTRMAQSTGDEKPTILAGNIEQEMRNTIEYLKRLSFADASYLNIIIIVGQDIKEHLSTNGFSANASHVITPHEASELLGMKNTVLSGDRFSDVLLASAFLKLKKKRLRLLPTYTKKTESYYNAARATKAVALLIVLGLLGASAMNMKVRLEASSNLSNAEKQKSTLSTRVTEFEDKAKTFKVDPFIVDSLIKSHDVISESSADYHSIIRHLIPFITANIVVQSLEWSVIGLSADAAQVNPVVAPPPPEGMPLQTDIINKQIRSIVTFELNAAGKEQEVLLKQWDKTLDAMKKSFKGYQLESTGIVGATANSDELNLNFEDSNTALPSANQKINISVTITGAEPATSKAQKTIEVQP